MDVVLDPRALQIQVDGSRRSNPGGQSGCAAMVAYPEHLNRADEVIVDYGCRKSTNQRMELMACLLALEWLRDRGPWRDVMRAQIISDSTYVLNGMASAPFWRKNGWRNMHGQPVFNSDLWASLLSARAKVGLRVDFVYQKGKTTPGGKTIDAAAKAAARRGGLSIDRGYKPGAYRRSMVRGGVALRYPATGQVAVIRPYAKKPVSRGEERVSFNLFDEGTHAFHSKFYAFATSEMAFDLHSWRRWRVHFNDEPTYPRIVTLLHEVILPTHEGRATETSETCFWRG